MKEHLHVIASVEPGSIAEELELEPGDMLLEINGNKIEDVFDYHYLMNEEYVELLVRKADGEEWELEIEKETGNVTRFVTAGCYNDDRKQEETTLLFTL